MLPMLIGHSQGGMLVVRTLHELAGDFADADPGPRSGHRRALPRTTFRDPAHRRGAAGRRAARSPFAAAIATGKLPRVLLRPMVDAAEAAQDPGHRRRVHRVHHRVGSDRRQLRRRRPVRRDGHARTCATSRCPRLQPYRHPADRSTWPRTRSRAPGSTPTPRRASRRAAGGADVDTRNLLHAADLWFSVKKHWCLEAQRSLRAQRARGRAMRGRLNLFQAAMLRWRELHPYNAVHVAASPRRSTAAPAARDRRPSHGARPDRASCSTRARAASNTAAAPRRRDARARRCASVRCAERCAPRSSGSSTCRSRATGAFEPFRFFAVDAGDSFHLGARLRPLHRRRRLDRRAAGRHRRALRRRRRRRRRAPPTCIRRPTARLFLRHPRRVPARAAELPAMAASFRRAFRPRYPYGHGCAQRVRALSLERAGARRAAPRGEGVGRHAQRPADRDDPADAVAAGRGAPRRTRGARRSRSRRSSTSAPSCGADARAASGSS